MTHILLYWNHICVLHRQEKAFLQELAGRLHRWTGQGKLRVRQPAEYYYETVLERTEP